MDVSSADVTLLHHAHCIVKESISLFFFTADGLWFMQSCRQSRGALARSFITVIVRQEAAVCECGEKVFWRRTGMTEEPIREERDLFV